MILEAIVTTIDTQGKCNIAPMGPIVADDFSLSTPTFELRPFKTSKTYANLKQTNAGVLHVTDDVLLFAEGVLGEANASLTLAAKVKAKKLADYCRAWEFEIREWDESGDRTRLIAAVVHADSKREFFGFNRAKHAVIELAILASRVGILEWKFLEEELNRLTVLVQKTGGRREFAAYELLREFISGHCEQMRENATSRG